MATRRQRQPNRLIGEKSPYLLQHAYNPVEWYPWCEEAFERAKREDKPVFLSIGYSTCHWCHVMAEESFEDEEVARLLNETFVCVKVDREERPDLDALYMNICQLLTGSGGWPLTIIMTPDKKPFYAATYIPKKSRFGMVGLLELVPKVREAWLNRRSEILESSENIVAALRMGDSGVRPSSVKIGEGALKEAYARLYEGFDEGHGGFGLQPKFPMAHRLNFLLRYFKRYGDRGALYMVEKTLRRMRFGGIFDQVGWGFHRYSTDMRWMIPHFEKMLYDQAAASLAYIEAYQVTAKPFYLDVAAEIFEFSLRELFSSEGAFYTALDADSEGVEGKYYLWSWEELESLLSADELKLFEGYYNVKREGNFASPEGGSGLNVLHAEVGVEEYAMEAKLDPQVVRSTLDRARMKLFTVRESRVRPGRDEKILSDLNGYMLAALAKMGRVGGSTKYLDVAENVARFLLSKMNSPDGGLRHVYSKGLAYGDGLLNDYAYVVWGLLELYEATFKAEYLREAVRINEYMVDHFWDGAAGGFFFTSDKSESVLLRQKDVYDGALPAGNSVAFSNLLRISRITGKTSYEELADRLLGYLGDQLSKNPEAFTQLLCGLDFTIGPTYEVVVAGRRRSAPVDKALTELGRRFLPNCVVVLKEPDDQDIVELCGYTKDMRGGVDDALIYVCTNFACSQPAQDVEEVLERLERGGV